MCCSHLCAFYKINYHSSAGGVGACALSAPLNYQQLLNDQSAFQLYCSEAELVALPCPPCLAFAWPGLAVATLSSRCAPLQLPMLSVMFISQLSVHISVCVCLCIYSYWVELPCLPKKTLAGSCWQLVYQSLPPPHTQSTFMQLCCLKELPQLLAV